MSSKDAMPATKDLKFSLDAAKSLNRIKETTWRKLYRTATLIADRRGSDVVTAEDVDAAIREVIPGVIAPEIE